MIIKGHFKSEERSIPTLVATHLVRNIGFEPIQSETTDLQSGPALPLRRLRMFGRPAEIRTPFTRVKILYPKPSRRQVHLNYVMKYNTTTCFCQALFVWR